MPEDLSVTPTEALEEAQRLLDEDRPFHAHEVLEAAWKAAPEAERELWRGLAQVAVGITHVRRGNARGARALLERAADRIDAHSADPPYGIDASGIVTEARRIAVQAAEGPDLTIRLRLTRTTH
jgi:predicted metal-dependent hydrolase